MDMNSSRPYSDDEEESGVSKKDVSFTGGLFFRCVWSVVVYRM